MWIHVPGISHSSQVSADSTSPSESLFQNLAASALWRGKSRLPKSWRLAWKRGLSKTRLSGLTCEASTVNRGMASWMESLAGFHAKIYPSPARVKESSGATDPASGSSSLESFAKFNPSGSLSKTSRQFSIFQQDEPYLENLPKWGSMRSGSLSRRTPLVLRTSGSGSSSWPTPQAPEVRQGYQDRTRGMKGSPKSLSTVAVDYSHPGPTTTKPGANCWCGSPGCDLPGHKRRLNVYFVENLQGLPLNWTSKTARIDCGHLEIWFVHCRALLHWPSVAA